ncbi:MAG: dihydroorotate dehydrogenase-like protein, partial [Verrucomicrobia bacterium]
MNLETEYLGLKLPHPLIPGASPLASNLDTVKQLEDAGAAAITMHSLFEEQLIQDQWSTHVHTDSVAESFAEATSLFPNLEDFQLGPDEYLEQLRKIKETVDIPVIASLNGTRIGGWIDHAKLIEEAGADALELNVYYVATDPGETTEEVESRTLDILRAVRAAVKIPLAIKLSPYYSAFANFARELDVLGADGLVLFNRFYQPDIDPENLETTPKLELSNSHELRLRLRWLGILCENVECSLACSGGVHRAIDVIKAVMAGADAVQCVSALLHFGPKHITTLLDGIRYWMEEHEY